MSITTHHPGASQARRYASTWLDQPKLRGSDDLRVAVPTLPAAVQLRLASLGRQHGHALSFTSIGSVDGGDLLRLETPAGQALTDQHIRSCWHRAPYTLAVCLVHHAQGAQHGLTLDTAVIGTSGSRADFLDRVARVTERLIADAICQASRGDSHLALDPAANARTLPAWLDRARAIWHARLFAEWWSIGQSDRSLQEILHTSSVSGVRWVAPRRGTAYLADPFPWPGRNAVLCEEMPFNGGIGRIVAFPLSEDGVPQAATVVLEDGAHHSYPCTFTEAGEVYFLPESTARGATRLYRFSMQSRPAPICSVAPGMRLADPTLFRHAGRYWIACTDLDFGTHDNLCLLYADHLTGPWHMHRCQPVKIDICGARPAGAPFVLHDQLFRPGQDCAGGYGAGVAIHRVDVLSPEHFHETVVARLRPDPAGPFPDGLHTLTADANRVWIDGKRYVFDPAGLCRKLIRRMGLAAKPGKRLTK